MNKKLLVPFGLVVGIFSLAWVLVKAPELPSPPLKDLAARHSLDLGVYLARDRLNENEYRRIATEQFAYAVIDGQPNWHFEDGSFRPAPDKYDYSRIDEVLGFAKKHSMPVRMHHLVWGEEKWLPSWLKDGNYSRDQLLKLMEEHITTVASHYRGQVREWTVVNEAFTRGNTRPDLRDWWGDRLGQEYIDKAFIWADKADPDAVLILNDFNNEYLGEVSDDMYEFIKGMLARKVPIDALGMQMHIDGRNPPTKESVLANMKRFGELGIKVYVTEFDVNMNDASGDERDKEQKQKQIYHDMLRACIESTYCPSFAYLGISDRESWYNELGVPNAMPLPFDRQYRPKPAYYGIREALEN